MEKNIGTKKKSGKWKILWTVLLAIAGIWAVILIVLQIALTPGVLTGAANRIAAQMVDGDVSFGKVRASVFRNFPYDCLVSSIITLILKNGIFWPCTKTLSALSQKQDMGQDTAERSMKDRLEMERHTPTP